MNQNPDRPFGVGFVGAGPVVQAIHLPTIARSGGRLAPAHVMDVDVELAASVAASHGARSSTRIEDVLADPDVDIVAICSPHRFHAAQAAAAIQAGKRAVLIEKPFATTLEDAEAITSAARAAGIPILVGAMHLVDPGWEASDAARASLHPGLRLVRSSITMPPNPTFEDYATEVIRPASTAGPMGRSPKEYLRGMILGLAIHDLPLVRRELPTGSDSAERPAISVLHAESTEPAGYLIRLRVDGVLIELHAQTTQHSRLEWTLELVSEGSAVVAHFPPSYIHAGGTRVVQTTSAGVAESPASTVNGYEREWHLLADAAEAGRSATSLDDLTADLRFALDIADAVDDHLDLQESHA